MPKNSVKALVITVLLGLSCLACTVNAQTKADSVKKLIAKVDTFAYRLAAENLYLQTDKPYYTVGDTIWFKAYLLEAGSLLASAKSGIMYAELVNTSNQVVTAIKIPIAGIGWGNIPLNANYIDAGNYTLRAYTRWMQNNVHHSFFSKVISVSNSNPKSWLINYNPALSVQANNTQLALNMQIVQADKIPVSLENVQLSIKQGNKTISRTKLKTLIDGSLKANFNIPAKANLKGLAVELAGGTEQKLVFPVGITQPQAIDLQFMPEGGYMVAGLLAHVGFKAINQQGKGVDVEGFVYDSNKQQVATIKSLYKGMGAFDFTPVAGQEYTAVLNTAAGQQFKLPAVKPSGIAMHIVTRHLSTGNYTAVGIEASADVMATQQTYYLLGQSRGKVCYAAALSFKNGAVQGRLPMDNYTTGAAIITLFNSQMQPLIERAFYVDKRDQLNVSVSSSKAFYGKRDSVLLDIIVTDVNNQPVQGSFSLSVTDDAQISSAFALSNSIKAQTLLQNNVKGDVETPGYYFENASATSMQALDNLLLTQGWTGYNWEDVFKPGTPLLYTAEQSQAITGKVTNMFNKPLVNSKLLLMSTKPFITMDTVTNKQGRFSFASLPVIDTATTFIIQARNARGKSFNVGIEVDDVKPAVFPSVFNHVMPWFINTDTIMLHNAKSSIVQQNSVQGVVAGTLLKAVTVNAKKVVKQSSNLNGAGNADLIFDEKDMFEANQMTLLGVLEKQVKGFRDGPIPKVQQTREYWVGFNRVKLIIDGVDIDRFFEPSSMAYAHYYYVKAFLDYYSATDIKGIEIMNSSKYSNSYNFRFLTPEELMAMGVDQYAYIEVTTWSKSGPFMKATPGIYTYRYKPFSLPKQFYRPRYTTTAPTQLPDLRSTIHWEPNLVTDGNGRATVSFYSADNAGKYTYTLEGADLNGHVGSQSGKIVVRAAP
jgi:hypothetical protein